MGAALDSIILLTGPVEQPVLSARLKACNPKATIFGVASRDELLRVEERVLAEARLIGFATPVIVPGAVLERLGRGAYNFHPGPPEFPGLSPAQFAIYRGAPQFGVTLHEMAVAVDAGPIVAARRFPLLAGLSVAELEQEAYRALAQLFWDFAPALAGEDGRLATSAEAWSGDKTSRRRYESLCAIPLDIAPDELDRRIAAFGAGQFGLVPTIILHGHRFQLVARPETGGFRPT